MIFNIFLRAKPPLVRPMKTKLISFICLLLWLPACHSPEAHLSGQNHMANSHRMPGEFEAQQSVWIGWNDYPPYKQPLMDIISALHTHISLNIVVSDSTDLSSLKQQLAHNEIDTSMLHICLKPDNRIWMRDHGPTFLLTDTGEKRVVDFGWTNYGHKGYLKDYYQGNEDSVEFHYQRILGETGNIDRLIAEEEGYEVVPTNINMEGGSIEVNGKGTLILCEAVTFQRNPGISRDSIEEEFKKALGVSNIIWMKEGLAEDPLWFNHITEDFFGWGTYGHTDEFVRFANDSTILLAWVDETEKNLNEINRINFDRLSTNFAILEKARDQEGQPFRIIKVPLPDPVFLTTTMTKGRGALGEDRTNWQIPLSWLPQKGIKKEGDQIKWVAASSYLNYLVTNEQVLLPSYKGGKSTEMKEAKVKIIFSEVFKGRKLIFLDVMNLNYHGGGIHCVTQQEPLFEDLQ